MTACFPQWEQMTCEGFKLPLGSPCIYVFTLRQSEKLQKLAGHAIVKHVITIRQEPKCPSMETTHSHQEEQRPRIYSETENSSTLWNRTSMNTYVTNNHTSVCPTSAEQQPELARTFI